MEAGELARGISQPSSAEPLTTGLILSERSQAAPRKNITGYEKRTGRFGPSLRVPPSAVAGRSESVASLGVATLEGDSLMNSEEAF